MGRAIEMENSISQMDIRLKKAEDALAKVIEIVDSMQEKSSKVTQVKKDNSVKKEKKNASKEKANNEATRGSDKQSDTRPKDSQQES